MKMTQTIDGTERTFYLVDGDKTTKIVKFEKDKQKRPVAVLPENSIGKLTFNLGKMIEENLTDVEISVNSSKMMREGTTPTTSTKTVKVSKPSKIEGLLKDKYPEIYEELERLVKIEALEAELKAQREIEKALKAQIETLKNTDTEEEAEVEA